MPSEKNPPRDDTVAMDRQELMYTLYNKQSGQLTQAFCECVRGNDAGKRFLFTDAKVVIGRSAQCNIQLHDQHVSGQHAVVRRGEIGIVIEDSDSSNGLFVNEQKVTRAVLADNDEIRIGESVLKVKL